MITVGQIVKPQGVRGEVKVVPMTDDPSRFCVLKSAYVGGKLCRIENARVAGDAVFIKFAGISDRNDAERLRGEYVTIDRAAAVALAPDEFFIADLIGATLVAKRDGTAENVGVVRGVQSFGAADVVAVELESGGEMSFAFVKALCAEFDDSAKCLYVDGRALDGVAVYDDED